MADYSAAIAQIKIASSLDEIQKIVGQYSAEAVGSGGILYSGPVGTIPAHEIATLIVASEAENGVTVNIIDKTARGQFLANSDVSDAIRATARNIYRATGLTPGQARSAAKDLLFGNPAFESGPRSIAGSLWGQAAQEFAASLSGDIKIIGIDGAANPIRTFGTVELPALLNNPDITSVGGVAISDLTKPGVNAFQAVLRQFTGAVADGGIFRRVAIAQETLKALGLNGAGASPAAELRSEGFTRVAPTLTKTHTRPTLHGNIRIIDEVSKTLSSDGKLMVDAFAKTFDGFQQLSELQKSNYKAAYCVELAKREIMVGPTVLSEGRRTELIQIAKDGLTQVPRR